MKSLLFLIMVIPKTIIAQNTGVVYLLNDQGEEVFNYPSGQAVVHIGLTDTDNPNDVHLRIGSPDDTVMVAMTRISPGEYTGTVTLEEYASGSVDLGDAILQARRGSLLTVIYDDESDSFGNPKRVEDHAYYGMTLVSGVYDSDHTWAKDNSPYLVTGDIDVKNGARLTIEPGVEILFTAPSFGVTGDDRAGGRDDTRSELRIVEGSTLHAVGTPEEKIIFRSSRERQEEIDRDWWGIFADNGPKIRLEHAKVSGSYYGLYFRDLGGSKTDTMYIRHNIFENIGEAAIRTEWIFWKTNTDVSHNILDGGIQIDGMHDDWNDDDLVSVKIANNDFSDDQFYLNTDGDNRYNDYKIILRGNRNLWTTRFYHPKRVISEDNEVGGRYEVGNIGDFSSRNDSLIRNEGAETYTGWSLNYVSKASISRSYVTGYDTGVSIYSSAVKIDSSSIIGNNNTGISISSDFDYGSRITVIEHSTITGNNGDGITLREHGQVIANYNNLNGNGGPEFSNQAAHTNEINARFNWWGDEATAQMNEGKNPKNIDEIYDEYDDASKGFVNYSDWLDAQNGTPSQDLGNTGEIYLVDNQGEEVLNYSLDRTIIYVGLTDLDNLKYTTVRIGSPDDTVMVAMTRISPGEYTGTVTLEEYASGSVDLGDAILQARRGSLLTVIYDDESDSFGNPKRVEDHAYYGMTLVSGVYDSDHTWAKDNSPYLVTGDIDVKNGARLTIEPGVEILFTAPSFGVTGDDRAGGRDDTRSELRIVEGSTLHAVGTPEEKIIFRSSRERQEEIDRDWWGIFADNGPKIRLEHAKVSGSYYGLYFRDLGGSKTDTMYIRHNIFENIGEAAIRTEWIFWKTNTDVSHNILDGGIQIDGMHDDWNDDDLVSVKIANNDFSDDQFYLNTDGDNRYNDYKIILRGNRNLWTTRFYHPKRVISEDNEVGGRYEVGNIGDFSSRNDSLIRNEGAETYTGWSLNYVSKASISRSYVTGYDTGVSIYSSAVKIDSSSIIGNNNTGISISSDFDYGSRITVIEHSTITGNNGDGITLREHGQVIANYNNLNGNGGPEFSNQAAHTNEINARFNWWGDEATAQMNEGKNPKNIDEIYDEYDDASKGFVNYSGWLDDKDGTPSLVCGDVTGDYFVSALDGSFILRHSVRMAPQYPLIGRDSTAADVTGNGFVSAYDAATVLKYIVGLPVTLNCGGNSNVSKDKQKPLITWSPKISEGQDILIVPINILNINTGINSIEIEIPHKNSIRLSSISQKPDNWEILEHTSDQFLNIAMFGMDELRDDFTLELYFEILEPKPNVNFTGTIRVNEYSKISMEPYNLDIIPKVFELYQNYPNPFNPSTQIDFSLPESANIQLEIYNILGQKVQTLKNERMAPGHYSITFEANSLSSGVYIYQLQMGNKVITKRMLLLK